MTRTATTTEAPPLAIRVGTAFYGFWALPRAPGVRWALRLVRPPREGEEGRVEYTIHADAFGTHCTCAGGTLGYPRHGGFCKHIKALSALAGLLPGLERS